ncbi:MAG TPA: diacylglycerol kinase family protein [Bryobacteraceae bacterium]|nr:diacylglycerol kinase family protein [Bryobacteraceae bacterium]
MAAAVIFNPRAGLKRGRRSVAEISFYLREAGFDHSIRIAAEGVEITAATREALRDGHEIVVAAGGDGTVNAVAAAVAGSSATLGVLPLGTLNHFAKDLGIPTDLAAAAQTLAAQRTDRVDVAEVNGRVFVNNSSLGIYPNIVIMREKRRRLGFHKWVALGLAAMQIARRFPFVQTRIRTNGEQVTERTSFVFVGNNEYESQGLRIGQRDSLDGGRLCLFVAAPVSRLGLMGMAIAAVLGVLDKTRSLRKFSVEEASIETRRRHIKVSTDGEVIRLRTPLHYAVRRQALKVIVP